MKLPVIGGSVQRTARVRANNLYRETAPSVILRAAPVRRPTHRLLVQVVGVIGNTLHQNGIEKLR